LRSSATPSNPSSAATSKHLTGLGGSACLCAEIDLIIRDLDDVKMIHVMAEENITEWASFAVLGRMLMTSAASATDPPAAT
jgi:hypothetical protein